MFTHALSVLGEALTDEDMAVKGYAIQLLAERGGPGAIERLRQVLRDPDTSVGMTVLASAVRSDRGRSLLWEALFDNDPTVRSFAALWMEQGILEER